MLSKDRIQKQIDSMPEKFSLDELIERLIVLNKIEKGIKDAEEGRTLTHEDMRKEIDSWFK